MTDERKLELGKRLKEMGDELQRMATEWGEATGLPLASIEISGTNNRGTVYSTAYLHEEDTQGNRRMVGVSEYLKNKENVIKDLFMYGRNDIVQEDKEDETEENTEE